MKVLENISLKEYNTFGIDVRARRMVVVEPEDGEEQLATLRSLPGGAETCLILGGGSNMVFTKNYDGTIIALSRQSLSHLSARPLVTAWGGMVMDDLIQWTLDNGLYGLENLSAIPGTVGASAVQNVGAYGAEAKDFIESVEAFDLLEGRLRTFSNADCRFAYRYSMFKDCPGRYLILRVTYRLKKEYASNLSYKALEGLPHATAVELRQAITDLRWGKLPRPEEHGSAGSFFKNPVVSGDVYMRLRQQFEDMPNAHPVADGYKLSAGWLIDRAGWKGRTQGRAGVWPKNALVLYNAGNCSGLEVVALAKEIQQDVYDKFKVRLDPEAIII